MSSFGVRYLVSWMNFKNFTINTKLRRTKKWNMFHNHNACTSVWHLFFILLHQTLNWIPYVVFRNRFFLVLANPSIHINTYRFQKHIISSEPLKMHAHRSVKYFNLRSCSLNGRNMIGNIVHWFFFSQKKKKTLQNHSTHIFCNVRIKLHDI